MGFNSAFRGLNRKQPLNEVILYFYLIMPPKISLHFTLFSHTHTRTKIPLSFYQGHDCQPKGSLLRFAVKSSTDVDTCKHCWGRIQYQHLRGKWRAPQNTSFAPLELQKGTGTKGSRIPLTSNIHTNTLRGRKHAYIKKNKQKRKEKCKKK